VEEHRVKKVNKKKKKKQKERGEGVPNAIFCSFVLGQLRVWKALFMYL